MVGLRVSSALELSAPPVVMLGNCNNEKGIPEGDVHISDKHMNN